MKFENCLWKNTLGEIVIYHTLSAYKVLVDEETLALLWDMCDKSPEQLNERQRQYYDRLAAHGMLAPDNGEIPEQRSQSPLVHVDLEIAARCNLACKHCFARIDGELMAYRTFVEVSEQLLDLGAISLSLNGGEPLLHPQIIPMIELARRHNFRTEIYSNGLLVTPEFCRAAAAAGIDKINISLDGFQEQHEIVRGNGTYAQTIAAIKLLRSYGIRVWINSILHAYNEPQLAAFQKFCFEELQANGACFVPVNPIGKASSNRELFPYPQKTRNVLRDLPEDENHWLRRDDMLSCRAGLASIYVSADEKVYPCNYFRRANVCLGDLRQNSLATIYRSHLEQQSIFTDFNYQQLHECINCPAFSDCRGGCRARAAILSGDLYGKDPMSCASRGLLPE